MPPGRFFNCRGAFSICNPSPSSTTMPFEHLMDPTIKIALIGAGMFGGDVHARAYADLQRAGIAPQLGRIGLDQWAREFAPIQFDLVAIATRTKESAGRAIEQFKSATGREPRAYSGEHPWEQVLKDFPDLDVAAIATPDDLHT